MEITFHLFKMVLHLLEIARLAIGRRGLPLVKYLEELSFQCTVLGAYLLRHVSILAIRCHL